MMRGVRTSTLAVATLAVLLAACATMRGEVEQRTAQGPVAEDVWGYAVLESTGRTPSFDERRHWDNQMDQKVSDYLRAHPDFANSLEVAAFRFNRQVTVHMTKEQVLLLLGSPLVATSEPARMEELARRYWPAIKAGGATEAWAYPLGWRIYFKDARVVDITQYLIR